MLQGNEHYSVKFLRDILSRKIERNPAYSMRAFAKDIGVSPTYISLLLKGKKKLSMNRAIQISDLLHLKEKEKQEFLKAVALERSLPYFDAELLTKVENQSLDSNNKNNEYDLFYDLDTETFKLLHGWHHLPILDLTTCANFVPDYQWIAGKLGIPDFTVRDAVDRLVRLGLLKIEGKIWTKTHKKLEIQSKTSKSGVRAFHKAMINKALKSLEDTSEEAFSKRRIGSLTVAVNMQNFAKAISCIEKFQKDLIDILSEGDCTELYQLNLQLFTLLKDQPIKRTSSVDIKKL